MNQTTRISRYGRSGCADEARKLFEDAQSASESAWQDVHRANQKAFAQLQKGWADAVSRFGRRKK